MSRALKQNDILELSKLYEAEFNQPDLHDRVLVFDVVASWPHRVSIPNVEENERNDNEASDQTEDGSEGEMVDIEKEGMSMNTGDENETESPDCEITSKYVNGNQQIENEESNQSEDDDIRTKTNENETAPTENEASNEIQENKMEDATVTDENETTLNKNVEIDQNTSNEIETRSHNESKITEDDNNASRSLNSEKQNENSSEPSSSENYEASHLHESEKPTLNDKDQSGKSSEGVEASYPTSDKFIRQHNFYIHSSWLAVQSSYFRSLFFSGMRESNAKEVHVQILASEEEAHLMLLRAMYKIDILDNASVDELLEVLRLAHKYDVRFVFKKCKYCLQAAVVSLDICEQIMHFTKVDNTITGVEDLVSTLQSFLANEFSPLDKTWQTTSFKELCEPSLKYLLSSDELVAASENTIFHALVYWIEKHGIDNFSKRQELPSLLSVVRFELIPIDYLYNIVQNNSVAKKLVDFNDHYLKGISYHALSDTMKQRLPHQPVEREASTEFLVPYTWVIPRDKLDTLVGTDKKLKSDEFWYCGYKMVLLIHVVKLRNLLENKAIFQATLSLAIIYLTQQSEVIIQWQPESQSFITTPDEQLYTFNEKACMSSVDINYKMEVQQEKSNKAILPEAIATRPEQTNNSGGFTGFGFSSPQPSSKLHKSSSGLNFGSSAVPKSSSGLNFGSSAVPKSSSGLNFGSSAVPKPSSGLNFGSSAVPKKPIGLTSSTFSTKSISGFSFSAPQPSVSPPKPSSGFNFGSSAVPTTTIGSTSHTAPSKPSGGFGLVASITNTLKAIKPVLELESSNMPCLSIDVSMKLV